MKKQELQKKTILQLQNICRNKNIPISSHWTKKDYIAAIIQVQNMKNNQMLFGSFENPSFITYQAVDYDDSMPQQSDFYYPQGQQHVAKMYQQYLQKYNKLGKK